MEPILSVDQLTKKYKDFTLDHISFQIPRGMIVGMIGENGAGKSTLIKGLLGLLKPTSGSIVMADDLKKTGIGYLPQQTAAQKGQQQAGDQTAEEPQPPFPLLPPAGFRPLSPPGGPFLF